jgi:hypothetical protein
MSTNPVFNFAVSEQASTDAWGTMLRETISMPAHRDENAFGRLTDTWQEEYKQETGAATMPGAYRSAKSVLKNAIKGGIPLLDAEGEPRGKTAIEKDIKAAKDAAKDTKTPEEKASIMAKGFVQFCAKHGLDHAAVLDTATSGD